jgi:hypothetical protein
MICTIVEGKEKLLAPKLNRLQKHVIHCKAKVSIPILDASSCYMNKNYVHAKNEQQYTTSQCPSIMNLLYCDVSSNHKQKYGQFPTIFHILVHGHFMTDFEGFKTLYQMLSMNNVSKKHWSNSSSWGIAKIMHGVLLDLTEQRLFFGEREQVSMIKKTLEYFVDTCT